MKTFEQRRRVLLRQMLPHTWIGHPAAAVLGAIGLQLAARAVHYYTLPGKTRRRHPFECVPFDFDRRIFWADAFFTPLASLAASVGRYRAAAWVFQWGPWRTCLEVGACGYYEPSEQELERRAAKEAQLKRQSEAKRRAIQEFLEAEPLTISVDTVTEIDGYNRRSTVKVDCYYSVCAALEADRVQVFWDPGMGPEKGVLKQGRELSMESPKGDLKGTVSALTMERGRASVLEISVVRFAPFSIVDRVFRKFISHKSADSVKPVKQTADGDERVFRKTDE